MRNFFFTIVISIISSYGLLSQNGDLPLRYQICNNCSTQEGADNLSTTYTYGPLLPYNSGDITSDFGARYLGYDWHKGVDYRPIQYAGTDDGGRGTAIIAAETGTVFLIRANQGYKYIVIDGTFRPPFTPIDLGYAHIFNSRNPSGAWIQSGAFALKAIDGTNPPLYAIVNLTTGTAIGQEEGTVTLNGTVYTVETEIESTDQAIAPMGGSGGGFQNNDPFPVHLHLYRFRNINANPIISEAHETNCMDPLTVIDHDEPDYEVKSHTEGQSFGNMAIRYPGTSATKFRVRGVMRSATDATTGIELGENGSATRYGNVVMNINDVEIQIKKQYESDYSLIQGAALESKISHGATPNTNLYPTYMALNDQRGSMARQGIASFAYASHPYDDFYFTDFITRIHKDDPMDGAPAMLSYCPMSTRYNDGRYQMRARVTDIRNGFTDADRDFTIDNYKPFIAHVKVQAGGLTFYERGWTCNDGAACQGMTLGQPMVNSTQVGYSHLSGGMYVTATASEPLGQLTLDAGTVVSDLQPYETEEDGRIQKFRINKDDALRLCSAGEIRFTFRGYDHSSNAILAFSTDNSSNCVSIPKRNSATTWTDDNISQSGGDVLHKVSGSCGPRFFTPENETVFTISAGEDCHMVDGMVTHATNGAADGAISLTVTGLFDVEYQYMWSNGATTQNISGLAPGTYTVTVSDGLCCEVVEEFDVQNGCATLVLGHINITPAFSVDCSDGCIDISIAGGTPPYSVEWYSGATLVSSVPNISGNDGGEDLCNIAGGRYRVIIRDSRGCIIDRRNLGVPMGGNNIIMLSELTNVTTCMETERKENCGDIQSSQDGAIAISVNYSGAYTITWSNGASGTNFISGLCPGKYTVTVTNSAGCTAAREFELCCCSDNSGPIKSVPRCGNLSYYLPINIFDSDVTSPTTSSASDGSINLHVFGGNPERISIQWSGPNGFSSTTEDLENLRIGRYCVTITDGCSSASDCFDLVDCSQVNISVTGSSQNTCQGYSLGSISAGASGGTPPYKFRWNSGQGTQSLSNLSAGVYTVTVTDKSGCRGIRSFTIGLNQLITVRSGCIFITTCNGTIVQQQDIGSFTQVRPSDCRILDEFCNDGVLVNSTNVGTSLDPVNISNCTVVERCRLTGQVFRTHQGTIQFVNQVGYDNANRCWWCHTFELCVFPSLGNAFVVRSVTSGLGISTLNNVNCGENQCYQRVYCSLLPQTGPIWEGCAPCSLSGCRGEGAGFLREQEITETRLIDGKPQILTTYRVEGFDPVATTDFLKENKLIDSDQHLLSNERYVANPPDANVQHSTPNFDDFSETTSLKFYPNPFNNELTIEINTAEGGAVQLKLNDITAGILWQKNEQVVKGINKFTYSWSNIPAGLYFLEVKIGNSTFVHKIVKIQ
ncbi:MAG: T9SS type A sorting domain-containing protein [Saprospiraceae bacterium]|nr:T9SS type A sorting domain-containing protein [Saprospiraceae bacterium]